jgi:steroid Delta-isomerase
MSDPQKMAAAVETYLASFAKRDHNAVADLFAEQCTVEDPIGTDIHKGREAVREFYKMAMANGANLTLEGQIRIVPPYAAFAFNVAVPGPDGNVAMRVNVIDTFKFNDDSKVVEMRAFWGPTNMQTA